MITSMLPGNSIWLQTHILEPYIEGSQRIERAWEGKETPAFIETPFSWKERVIFLIKGALLMIPLINTIVWVVMQVFGEPKLSDTYCFCSYSSETSSCASSETEEIELPNISPPSHTINIDQTLLAPPSNQQTFWYREKIGDLEFEGKWTVTTSNQETVIKKTSSYNNSTTVYNDGKLQSIENHIPKEKTSFVAKIEDNNQLKATRTVNKKSESRSYDVSNKGFWIQQPLFGFKNFAESKDKKLNFFFIHPETLELVEMLAEKREMEQKGELGHLLKIETRLPSWIGALHKGVIWVNPITKLGLEANCPPLFIPSFINIPHMTEVFLPNHP